MTGDAPRLLLVTGKGGVGKTSVATATALRAARPGRRVLLLSTDPAHSLADALDLPLGDRPSAVTDHLDAQQLDARVRLEEAWGDIRAYLVRLFAWGGAAEIEAEELAVLPGLDELFALQDLRDHATSGAYDAIVVDCAPTAETLRLLSLPDVLGWYLERVFPVQRVLTKAVRPVVERVSTMPVPGDGVLAAVERLAEGLTAVRELLTDRRNASVRLVVNPERMVVAEAQRTHTQLSLFGYALDGVVVNRMLPDAVADPWFAAWRTSQATQLDVIRDGFVGVDVRTAPLMPAEVVGVDALRALGAALYPDEPLGPPATAAPLRLHQGTEGWVLELALPFADRDDLDVFVRRDELHVHVGSGARSLALPGALRDCEVRGAALRDGVLTVRFAARQPVGS